MSSHHDLCGHCGRPFKPDRFNRHHQKYCTRPECVLERARARKRKWYRGQYKSDASFHAAEKARCRAGLAERRAASKTCPPAAGADPPALLLDAVVGLISQLADTSDPLHLRQLVCGYADRGRRLAISGAIGPPFRPPENISCS